MVRCMMEILFLIGKEVEKTEVIDQLFDTSVLTERPNYNFADPNGLILADCVYNNIKWTN